MNTTSICRTSNLAGHAIRSVVARDEPEQSFARSLSDLSSALPSQEDFARKKASLRAVVTTPDFHPGKPVPVGVIADIEGAVLPHMIGSDMRMIVLEGVTADQLSTPYSTGTFDISSSRAGEISL